jgi:hypothetical protein
MRVGGRAEYFLTGPKGERWAHDGEENAEDPNMPSSMKFTFDTTPAGSRMTCVTQFAGVGAIEQVIVGMEEDLRAAMPQLDAVLAEARTAGATWETSFDS